MEAGAMDRVDPTIEFFLRDQRLRDHPLGREATVVGRVETRSAEHGPVALATRIGGTRPVDPLSGSELPRIC